MVPATESSKTGFLPYLSDRTPRGGPARIEKKGRVDRKRPMMSGVAPGLRVPSDPRRDRVGRAGGGSIIAEEAPELVRQQPGRSQQRFERSFLSSKKLDHVAR
jgi:hypothetical protein